MPARRRPRLLVPRRPLEPLPQQPVRDLAERIARVRDELLAGDGTYWVEGPAANADPAAAPAAPGRLALHVRPYGDRPPPECVFEITTREQVFAPNTQYLGFVRVKSFTIEHAGNPFPRPQRAALSTSRGHHWILEGNTVRWANSVGVDVGHQGGRGKRGDKTSLCGYNIVRGNTVTDCGVCGIAASEGLEEGRVVLRGTLVEDNLLERIGWQSCEALMENAAIKLHVAEGCLARRNLIRDTHQASGIWLDWQNVNSRVTQNISGLNWFPSHGLQPDGHATGPAPWRRRARGLWGTNPFKGLSF